MACIHTWKRRPSNECQAISDVIVRADAEAEVTQSGGERIFAAWIKPFSAKSRHRARLGSLIENTTGASRAGSNPDLLDNSSVLFRPGSQAATRRHPAAGRPSCRCDC